MNQRYKGHHSFGQGAGAILAPGSPENEITRFPSKGEHSATPEQAVTPKQPIEASLDRLKKKSAERSFHDEEDTAKPPSTSLPSGGSGALIGYMFGVDWSKAQ